MSLVRIMVRSLTMIPVFISIFWTVLPGYGIFVAIMGSWLAIALAELDILNALRTRVVITGTILFNLLIVVVLNWLVQLTSISELFGGTSVLVAHTLLWSILGVGSVVLGLRLMAKRSGAWFFVEMGLIALATAVIFFPHQYKIVIRPLWLSDLAWSIGLEPSVALGLIGAGLATILCILTVFERSNRVHRTVVLFPLLALLTLIFVDPMEMESPPPPERLEDILNGGQTPTESQSGSGKADPNEQGVNSGDQEKQEGQGPPPPVAVILFGDDYTPPNEVFYLRQEIQSQFNGLRLVAPTKSTIPYNAPRGFSTLESIFKPPPGQDEFRKNVIADVALLTSHTAPIILESPLKYTPTVNPRPGRFVRTYRTESSALTIGYEQFLDFHIGSPEWGPSMWEHLTQTPPDKRYGELASQIVSSLPNEYRDNLVANAFAIKLYLDEVTRYTMKERHELAEDPTAEFLFGPHQQFTGYCVHTSHAAVYLWRSLGIPARIGVGYAPPAEQQKGSALLVLGNDAHSWPELYFEELGWVILDVAPQTVLDEVGDPPDLEVLDALEELARAEPDSQFRKAIDWAGLWVKIRPYVINTLGFFTVTTLIALILRKVRRRFRYRSSEDPYWVYISAIDELCEIGVSRQRGESPEHFAGRLTNQFPSLTPIVWGQVENVYSDNIVAINPLRQYRVQLHEEIVNASTWWKRSLGWVDLLSTWRSR